MTWSYDNTLPTDKDKVRALVGDTNELQPLVEDELIMVNLSEANGNIYRAAAITCISAAGVLEHKGAVTIGPLSVDYGSLASAMETKAGTYAKLADQGYGLTEAAMPIWVQTPPNFIIGMDDNPEALIPYWQLDTWTGGGPDEGGPVGFKAQTFTASVQSTGGGGTVSEPRIAPMMAAQQQAVGPEQQLAVNPMVATPVGTLPSNIDLALYQGDDFYLDITVTNDLGQPVDLTGYTAKAQIRATAASGTASDFTATISTPTNVVHLRLTAAVAAALPTTDSVWDVQIVDPTGVITTLAYGKVTVTAEVTKP